MAISGSGGSKWLDLSGSQLDLGGIHPGWSAGAINQTFLAISIQNGWRLQMAEKYFYLLLLY